MHSFVLDGTLWIILAYKYANIHIQICIFVFFSYSSSYSASSKLNQHDYQDVRNKVHWTHETKVEMTHSTTSGENQKLQISTNTSQQQLRKAVEG